MISDITSLCKYLFSSNRDILMQNDDVLNMLERGEFYDGYTNDYTNDYTNEYT